MTRQYAPQMKRIAELLDAIEELDKPDSDNPSGEQYLAIVNDAHLLPEPEHAMDRRLGDAEKAWRDAEGGVTAL